MPEQVLEQLVRTTTFRKWLTIPVAEVKAILQQSSLTKPTQTKLNHLIQQYKPNDHFYILPEIVYSLFKKWATIESLHLQTMCVFQYTDKYTKLFQVMYTATPEKNVYSLHIELHQKRISNHIYAAVFETFRQRLLYPTVLNLNVSHCPSSPSILPLLLPIPFHLRRFSEYGMTWSLQLHPSMKIINLTTKQFEANMFFLKEQLAKPMTSTVSKGLTLLECRKLIIEQGNARPVTPVVHEPPKIEYKENSTKAQKVFHEGHVYSVTSDSRLAINGRCNKCLVKNRNASTPVNASTTKKLVGKVRYDKLNQTWHTVSPHVCNISIHKKHIDVYLSQLIKRNPSTKPKRLRMSLHKYCTLKSIPVSFIPTLSQIERKRRYMLQYKLQINLPKSIEHIEKNNPLHILESEGECENIFHFMDEHKEFVIYTTKYSMLMMSKSKFVFVDGTFKALPKKWRRRKPHKSQLLIVHGGFDHPKQLDRYVSFPYLFIYTTKMDKQL